MRDRLGTFDLALLAVSFTLLAYTVIRDIKWSLVIGLLATALVDTLLFFKEVEIIEVKVRG